MTGWRREWRVPRRAMLVAAVAFAAQPMAIGCSRDAAPATYAPPLSETAQLGRDLFFDSTLSGSGRLSCASCHMPARAYSSPSNAAVQLGGLSGHRQGARAVPSLRYVDRTPTFGIGPSGGDDQAVTVPPPPSRDRGSRPRVAKLARIANASAALVPHGGLFWDGRAATLQEQALTPLLNPAEMANRSAASLAAHIRSTYGARLERLLGAPAVAPANRLLAAATFAIARFEVEDSTFHPYDSKYDAYLDGKATLSPQEARGLALFENPAKGNCAACHLDRRGADGRPPMFTDYEYEALGVPRNRTLTANADPRYFDLGLCGPLRADLAAQVQYCGMFRTPSLRNVAERGAYFHNGVARSLDDVLRFYAFRDTRPDSVYPRAPNGIVKRFDDLPARYAANVDTTDPPFTRRRMNEPPLTRQEMDDIIAFLKTLSDGYSTRLTHSVSLLYSFHE